MNTGKTSKEAILQACRTIVSEQGLSALNMRSVAAQCHIALGSLYNYYADKNELLLATVESVWADIFHMDQPCTPACQSFAKYTEYIFTCIRRGAEEYPHFLTAHAMELAQSQKDRGRDTMNHYFQHMKNGFLEVLKADKAVSPQAFSSAFSEMDFVIFVLEHLLLLQIQGKSNCDTLLEVIRKVLYT